MIDIIRLGVAIYLLYATFFGVENYCLLRWIVFLGVGFVLFVLWVLERVTSATKKILFWILLAIVILFNPILPIYLYDRGLWILIDFVTAIVLIIKPMLINSIDKPQEQYDYRNHK